jgi:UDP-galactopyranose mutase
MPINLKTINDFYEKNFTPFQAKKFINRIINRDKFEKPNNLEEKAISLIGRDLYNAFIKEYTSKQWRKDPKLLPPSIINRLPVRFNYDNTYFNNARWQGIPDKGYTDLFEKILDHKLINLNLNVDYMKEKLQPRIATIYTGPLDELHDYKFGKLEWKSVSFKKKIVNHSDYQGNSVINYSDKEIKYTRIHEPRHLHPDRNYPNDKTLLIYEYPDQKNQKPYYPVNDTQNRIKHRKYKKLCDKIDNFFIGGRLGDYSYYDMDMTISAALKLFENKIKKLI